MPSPVAASADLSASAQFMVPVRRGLIVMAALTGIGVDITRLMQFAFVARVTLPACTNGQAADVTGAAQRTWPILMGVIYAVMAGLVALVVHNIATLLTAWHWSAARAGPSAVAPPSEASLLAGDATPSASGTRSTYDTPGLPARCLRRAYCIRSEQFDTSTLLFRTFTTSCAIYVTLTSTVGIPAQMLADLRSAELGAEPACAGVVEVLSQVALMAMSSQVETLVRGVMIALTLLMVAAFSTSKSRHVMRPSLTTVLLAYLYSVTAQLTLAVGLTGITPAHSVLSHDSMVVSSRIMSATAEASLAIILWIATVHTMRPMFVRVWTGLEAAIDTFRELRAREKELVRADARATGLRLFVRYLGHEVRNPLHAAVNSVEDIARAHRTIRHLVAPTAVQDVGECAGPGHAALPPPLPPRPPCGDPSAAELASSTARVLSSAEEDVHTLQMALASSMMTLSDVLDYNKLLEGALPIKRSPTVVRDILRDTHRQLRSLVGKHGQAVAMSCADDVPEHILSSHARIIQVLMNAGSNASKSVTRRRLLRPDEATRSEPDIELTCSLLPDSGAIKSWVEAHRYVSSVGNSPYIASPAVAGGRLMVVGHRPSRGTPSAGSGRFVLKGAVSGLGRCSRAILLRVRDAGVGLDPGLGPSNMFRDFVQGMEIHARQLGPQSRGGGHTPKGQSMSTTSRTDAPSSTLVFNDQVNRMTVGTGLGLALVKLLVRSLGGVVGLGDREDGKEGCDFVCVLPADAPTGVPGLVEAGTAQDARRAPEARAGAIVRQGGSVAAWGAGDAEAGGAGGDAATACTGGAVRDMECAGAAGSVGCAAAAVEADAEAGERAGAAEAGRGRRLRILVADDELSNQRLLQRMLTRMGHEAVVVSDGVDVLRHLGLGVHEDEGAAGLGECPFDILLLDVQMHVMCGDEVATRLRAAGMSVPIVFCSGHAALSEVRMGELGVQGLLTKPFTAGDVCAVLTTVLGR